MNEEKKSGYILIFVLLLYLGLVSMHKGEFWPFSIYPMFSEAGKPWSKTLVKDVSDVRGMPNWNQEDLQHLAGTPVALNNIGVSQNDLSNFITKTHKWDDERIAGLRALFHGVLEKQRLLIYQVTGRIDAEADQRVEIKCIPFVLLAPDTTVFNPLEVKEGNIVLNETSNSY